MLNVICWKWEAPKEYRAKYTSEHVNILQAMLQRHLTVPHKLTCVTDNPEGLNSSIEFVQLWNHPVVKVDPKKPNCYRRLKMYSGEARELFGERILSLDLDVVIVANIDSLVQRTEEFVAWNKKGVPYQGGMVLHTTGTRQYLWDDFDPLNSPKIGKARGFVGSDQAWVSAMLPPNEATWTPEKHGVLSYKSHVRNNPAYLKAKKLPPGTKMVFYHGSPKPWETSDLFVRENYRI